MGELGSRIWMLAAITSPSTPIERWKVCLAASEAEGLGYQRSNSAFQGRSKHEPQVATFNSAAAPLRPHLKAS